ncbi:UDP-glucoronosyl and UDP-glucosyl transferase [Aspergillus sclerotialis]|uniref:UDP-glucoronosyl and UDP-glucosyl transferase n=1 Tax=Aspergillus sclerotialis TaxID=2070753 RepID=A0A3A2ZEW1_9EURO|nr:UDP-glucoronosyl and UDP-glucosyl transferase [Aspergillus sclerotialis]
MAVLVRSTKLLREYSTPSPSSIFTDGCTSAGVPQVVLPLWWDTYEYTTQAEWLGVGVGGNRKHAPNVNADEVSGAVLKILDSESGRSIRNRASEVASWFKDRPGRDVAAEHIVRMLSLAGNRTDQKQDPWARRDEL